LSWQGFGADGVYDVIFSPRWGEISGAAEEPRAFYRRYGNTPTRGRGDRELGRELLDHLRRSLPDYMVPAAIVGLEALPVTPNGKLDRKALPEPGAGAYASREYEPPEGEAETKLARIWSQLLSVERVGRNEDFFQLGGHSLLTVKAVYLLAKENIKVAAMDLFTNPTIATLTAKINMQSAQTREERAVCIRKGGPEAPLFLAHDGLGELMYGLPLSSHIDPAVSVYGLPASSMEQAPLRTMEAMAMRMVGMIREAQPSGPYRLAGWSFGGVLAYEIATQLIGADEEVEFLGLFDSIYDAGTEAATALFPDEFNSKDVLLSLVERRAQ